MKYIFSILIILATSGCSTLHNKYQSDSISDLNSAFKTKPTTQPSEAILSLSKNGSLVAEGETYYINSSTAEIVKFEAFTSPALLAMLEIPVNNIIIKSYVISPNIGPKYLFYPIITSYDEKFNKISEVLPLYEFVFEDNILTNTFKIPSKSKYVLIHSKPKFMGMEFSESDAGDDSATNASIGAVLGGAIGGIFGALTSGSTDDRPFYFAPGGALSVELN